MSRSYRYRIIFLAAALAASAFSQALAADKELTVSAAISLKEALTELGLSFERAHSGTRILFNFGSSGDLALQIEQGADVDVFAAASSGQFARLTQERLLENNSSRLLTKNKLVAIAPLAGRSLSSLSDFKDLHLIAIGNPATVPAGQYAKLALEKAKIYNRLLGEHKLIFAENVRQVTAYVESGDVDAGLVYVTDAKIAKQAKTCFLVPLEYTGQINYPVGIVLGSKQKALSKEFVQYITSRQAKAVFRSKGFYTSE